MHPQSEINYESLDWNINSLVGKLKTRRVERLWLIHHSDHSGQMCHLYCLSQVVAPLHFLREIPKKTKDILSYHFIGIKASNLSLRMFYSAILVTASSSAKIFLQIFHANITYTPQTFLPISTYRSRKNSHLNIIFECSPDCSQRFIFRLEWNPNPNVKCWNLIWGTRQRRQ